MYVHIGGEYSISDRLIIGIFDMDTISPKQTDTVHFLRKAEAEGRIEYISNDIPKSVVLTIERIYISPISAATIRKRMSESYGHLERMTEI